MYRNTGARITNVSFRIVDIANHARYSTPVQLETQMITVHPTSLEMHRKPSEHIGTLLCSKYTRLKQGIAVSHHYNSKNRSQKIYVLQNIPREWQTPINS